MQTRVTDCLIFLDSVLCSRPELSSHSPGISLSEKYSVVNCTGNLTPPASITENNSTEMAEVESVSIQWREEEGEEEVTRVEVAGQFSNWQPLTMSRLEGGSWEIR